MSSSKKKVVVTTASKSKVRPTVSKTKSKRNAPTKSRTLPPVVFGKMNYILMLAGIVLIMLGLILMAGGGMDDPSIWDESKIYSARRTVLAPFVIILGLVVEIFAIFWKEKTEMKTDSEI